MIKEIINIFNKIKNNHIFGLLIIAFVLLVFFIAGFIQKMFIFIIAIILCGISRFFQRFIPLKIGFELIVLFTSCISIAFGFVAGIFFGIISMAFSLYLSDEIRRKWAFICFISISLVSFIASFFPYNRFFSLPLFGLVLALAYDICFHIIYSIVFGRMSIIKGIVFYSTHLYFNYILFLYFADKIILLLI